MMEEVQNLESDLDEASGNCSIVELVRKKTSTFHPLIQLCSSPEALCATEPRLILQHAVTLRLRQGKFSLPFGADDCFFKITCANTDAEYFRCQQKMSLSRKRVLWDITGNPVLNWKKTETRSLHSLTPTPEKCWQVFPGDHSPRGNLKRAGITPLFEMQLRHGITGRGRLIADFTNASGSCDKRHVVLNWNGYKDVAVIYCGEPKQDGFPVAKLYSGTLSKTHYLEIAPKVDVALIVTMCIAALSEK